MHALLAARLLLHFSQGDIRLPLGFFLIGSLGGLLWVITYLVVIRDGFRDKDYGIPLVAICLNFGWELLGSFVWPNPVPLWLGMDRVWLLMDAAILWLLLRHGRRHQQAPLVRRYYYLVLAITLGLGLVGQYAFTLTYYDPLGFIIAFIINLVMSILFVHRVITQGDARGLSVTVAWTKMLGTLGTAILSTQFIPLTHPALPSMAFFYFLFGSILFFDCLYILLVSRAPRAVASARPG